MRKVNKNSPLPLYYQLKEILREMIDNEELKPGDAAPPERELCEIHGISRMTARKAVTALVNEGVLYREQGKGTFVAEPKPQHQLNQLRGFTDEMMEKGLVVQTKILSFKVLEATVALKKRLKMLPHQNKVLEIQRLRIIDGLPFALETVWLNHTKVPDLTKNDLEGGSLYNVLKEKYNRVPCYATQTIEPVKLDEYESQLLQMPDESLALLFRRTTYTKNEEIMEYTKCIYRTDTHKYEVLLKADG
ncbi:GntR family transcriptional regulator [Paenactinomyces guangxiensis]|uniref:GntR family transcriptional regulator n=1 Tax=Paenactinomyces guangxiensis TaxID=1490290 RepID=A0A7W1WNB0_9BACL|nr:GntR family transcriptional regulator [Paenactinomyces guangxiensis]MBA4492869.1 GntR family transcriptional regulator [Paenactinomyces guangxiensis]MBH8590282.1 GntR family transcriptional regulator [Paenactinomyces guangxiensis]